ncbi:MAG: DUF4268 domain-containing protein [Candidatus Sumerlaeaceae bacterium]
MPTAQLARLERVDLRTAWPNEAGDFTPWLAQPENLRLLGETIGIELECATCENPVGDFSADIICQNTFDDKLVLIENQIERTDHDHLGKLLTYTAGRKASFIVWVAKTFREEHRAALDWLNENTSEEFSFFGLEVELWRIADSPPAPKFNIVCQPNNWSRREHEIAREDGELSEGKQLNREYWTAFMAYLREHGRQSTPKPLAQLWMNFPVGRSGMRLSTVASTYNTPRNSWSIGELRMEVLCDSEESAAIYEQLAERRVEIEAALEPDEVCWHKKPGVRLRRLYVRRDADIHNRTDWPAQHEWLLQRLHRFEKVFRPLVAELPKSGLITTSSMIE